MIYTIWSGANITVYLYCHTDPSRTIPPNAYSYEPQIIKDNGFRLGLYFLEDCLSNLGMWRGLELDITDVGIEIRLYIWSMFQHEIRTEIDMRMGRIYVVTHGQNMSMSKSKKTKDHPRIIHSKAGRYECWILDGAELIIHLNWSDRAFRMHSEFLATSIYVYISLNVVYIIGDI
jgi:hypothetical protein